MHDIVVPEVEALSAMPDEKDKANGDWSMPEPVYQSSEGRSLRAEAETPESDIQIGRAHV